MNKANIHKKTSDDYSLITCLLTACVGKTSYQTKNQCEHCDSIPNTRNTRVLSIYLFKCSIQHCPTIYFFREHFSVSQLKLYFQMIGAFSYRVLRLIMAPLSDTYVYTNTRHLFYVNQLFRTRSQHSIYTFCVGRAWCLCVQ